MTDVPTVRDYIQAGYPCLYLPTVEPLVAERRVKAALVELGIETQVEYGTWKVTTGLMTGRADGVGGMQRQNEDLIDALAWIEKKEGPIVVCLHNIRQFVNDYGIIQQLLDTIMSARLKGQHVILIGAYLDLPSELRNYVTWCDCPLPSVESIQNEYRKMVKKYERDITLPKKKEELDDLIKRAATSAVGLDMLGAENALALSLALHERIDVGVIQAQKEQEVRKSDVLEFISSDETMDNVGGFGALKPWLERRKQAFGPEAREYGLPYPKGMLFVGPAGTGKSLVAKATGHYLGLPVLRLDMGKVFRSLVGESEAAIRMALQVAEAVSPVVLWMDEIDKGLAGMRGSGELDSGVSARVVSTVLTWRQETTKPVLLVATANDVAAIPSMVYRKGRLDEVWATDLPTELERTEIVQIHIRKRGRDHKKYKTALIAKKCDGFVPAEIESCVEDAMYAAFEEGKEFTTNHIMKAIEETIPQSLRDREELDVIRNWVSTRARLVSGDTGGNGSDSGKNKIRKLRAAKKS